jgi:hypothetical protein
LGQNGGERARRYLTDITVGEQPWQRGHWSDRLAAIDADIANMAKRAAESAKTTSKVAAPAPRAKLAIAAALTHPRREQIDCRHTPEPYLPDKGALYIELEASEDLRVNIWYRHLNQAERWQTAEMLPLPESDRYRASIPAGLTNSVYPVQYYFEVRLGPERVRLYPGFDATLANQPYFVVRPL